MSILRFASRFVPAISAVLASVAGAQGLAVNSSQTDINYGFDALRSPDSRWQEFTASFDNIEQIDLFIHDQHRVDSTLTVWLTDSGGTTLWATTLPDSALPDYDFLVVDTSKISVVPGNQYRVNLSVDKWPNDGNNSSSVFWMGSTAPTSYFVNDVTSSWATYSYGFRIMSAVPELGSSLLLATGIGLLALRSIRNRHRKAIHTA